MPKNAINANIIIYIYDQLQNYNIKKNILDKNITLHRNKLEFYLISTLGTRLVIVFLAHNLIPITLMPFSNRL
jgi:hypothetical protein